ncbi:MAG: GNAT family N-acetyltransferase [Thermomicrobiales bacterium]|nr:GNAT family N-acetyltransferase [Thermomicrobiales bacterium]MCO5223335.1 GNAT family N-acetyltransferase [Thermomicrobiales bacterium]
MTIPTDLDLRLIEEAALRAWPAGQQLVYSGWIARLSDGYTKRANSALLLYPQPTSASIATIEQIERLYRSQGLPPIFRLLSFTSPADLEIWLAERGYREADPTLVMALDLAAVFELDPGVRKLDIEQGIEAHARMNDLSPEILPAHRRILERIPGGLSFFGLFEDDTLIACGLSVVDGNLVGLFDIVTDPSHRRKGLGARLVHVMLAHAFAEGATSAYLQVVSTNSPAIALYQKLGFQEAYRYAYRIGAV